MNYRKLLIGCVFLVTACVSDPTPPSGTLDKETMVAILTEIHLAEAQSQQAGFKTTDSTQLYYKYLEKQILKKFHTDSTHYHDSFKFYSTHVKQMNEIYKAVVDTLEAQHQNIRSIPDTSRASQNKPANAAKIDSTIRKRGPKKLFGQQ